MRPARFAAANSFATASAFLRNGAPSGRTRQSHAPVWSLAGHLHELLDFGSCHIIGRSGRPEVVRAMQADQPRATFRYPALMPCRLLIRQMARIPLRRALDNRAMRVHSLLHKLGPTQSQQEAEAGHILPIALVRTAPDQSILARTTGEELVHIRSKRSRQRHCKGLALTDQLVRASLDRHSVAPKRLFRGRNALTVPHLLRVSLPGRTQRRP